MYKFLVYNADPAGTYCIEMDKNGWKSYPTNDLSTQDIVFYTDKMIFRNPKIGKVRIALLFEPKDHKPEIFNYIVQNYKEFDYVITWDKELLAIDERFKFMTFGSVPLGVDQFVMYEKTKLLSIVASEKNFLHGHRLRHQIIANYSNRMDLYGRGYNPISSLLPAFKDYMFSICIENVKRDWGFSEKITTPILCGTIPIYYGCDVSNFLDQRGIINFNNFSEIYEIINSLNYEKYQEMLPYAQINFEKAKKFKRTEDNIFGVLLNLGLVKDET
jgi:hypothetical protein